MQATTTYHGRSISFNRSAHHLTFSLKMPASSPKPKQAGFWGAHQKACLLAFACQAAKTAIPGFRPGPRTLAKPANAKTSKHTERKAMSTVKAWMMFATCTNNNTPTNNDIATKPTRPHQHNSNKPTITLHMHDTSPIKQITPKPSQSPHSHAHISLIDLRPKMCR
jgi:hypothetical protein